MNSIVQGESIDILLDLLETLDDEEKQQLVDYAKIRDAKTLFAAAGSILIVAAIFVIIKPVELAVVCAAATLAMIFSMWTGGKKHKRLVKSNNVVK